MAEENEETHEEETHEETHEEHHEPPEHHDKLDDVIQRLDRVISALEKTTPVPDPAQPEETHLPDDGHTLDDKPSKPPWHKRGL